MKFEDPTQETLYQMIKERLMQELKAEHRDKQFDLRLTDPRKQEKWDKFP